MPATIVGPVSASPGLPGGASSAINITGAQVIKGRPGLCVRLTCITAGTPTLNDAATTGAAAASNEFFSGALTAGQVVPLNWPCAAGIVVSAVSAGVFSIAFS